MKRQKLPQAERIDKDYKVMSNSLSRIIQIAYEDETQLRRLKAWYNLIGLAINDITEEKKNEKQRL